MRLPWIERTLLDYHAVDFISSENPSKGDHVAVAGIGHGDEQRIINVYPVHRIDGREP